MRKHPWDIEVGIRVSGGGRTAWQPTGGCVMAANLADALTELRGYVERRAAQNHNVSNGEYRIVRREDVRVVGFEVERRTTRTVRLKPEPVAA